MRQIQTVTGPVRELGLTLVHEHLLIGYPGWQLDALAPAFVRAEVMARAVDKLAELHALGVRTLVDPCPIDLGRDVEFMARVSERSRVNIVCATGMYKEDQGISYTFKALRPEDVEAIFVKELSEGIGGTGIRAGLVKVASGAPTLTPYEEKMIRAGGRAAAAVGCPVLTHTDHAQLGLEQLALLGECGVPAHRILIGHSDGRNDHAYHRSLAELGAYLGFDRFGLTAILKDEERIEAVLRMIEAGFARSLCLSHDAICGSWLGRPSFDGKRALTPARIAQMLPDWEPTHLFRNILPIMRTRGLTPELERTLLVDNPARYFAGAESPLEAR
ncbi:MAG: phosphotriesterase-related protein [Polyangiales bacterium]